MRKLVFLYFSSSHLPCILLKSNALDEFDIGIDIAIVFIPVRLESVLVKAESMPPDTPTTRLLAGRGILLT